MAVNRLPSGRYRVQLYIDGRLMSIAKVPGVMEALSITEATFPTERAARKAETKAYEWLEDQAGHGVTVQAWRDRWISDPLFTRKRPKESTRIHNEERVRRFVETYGTLPLAAVGDVVVSQWIAGGANMSTIAVLKAMFNDAASREAGRLIQSNPFEGLEISKGSRSDEDIPDEDTVRHVIAMAREKASPSFAAWLQVGAYTGMRPGELDALRWSAIEWDDGKIRVVEQFSAKSKTFTLPKNGRKRKAVLTDPAREALLGLPQSTEFCFTNLHGKHWTASARAYHWNAVRAASGFEGDFYEAGRHFAGKYMVNVLGLDSELVAIALGHTDGGDLVRRVYGHRDRDAALESVREAYAGRSNVVPLKAIKEGA